MNRLHHIKQTLISNIENNLSFGDVEFVLLDYNSADGLEDWAKQHLMHYINKGILRYFRTSAPLYFNHSHAKNMALRLSTGNIICSINADHFLCKGFAGYINQIFLENEQTVVTPIPKVSYSRRATDPTSGSWGRVCMLRSKFDEIGGYDETMKKYGNDDIDLVNRLQMTGVTRKWLRQQRFNRTISHDNEQRYSSLKIHNDVEKIFVSPLLPDRSEIVYLFKNKVYERFILIDNATTQSDSWKNALNAKKKPYSHDISDFEWQEGHWYFCNNQYHFDSEAYSSFIIPGDIRPSNSVYHEVTNEDTIQNLSILNYTQFNLNKMRKLLHEKIFRVNPDGYGQGSVSCNFSADEMLFIN